MVNNVPREETGSPVTFTRWIADEELAEKIICESTEEKALLERC